MMKNLWIPENYRPGLNVIETEAAIKDLRIYFEEALATALNLQRVSAPLFVRPESGLNDDLNGVERAVSFDIYEDKGVTAEIVQSLAKWKRHALGKYGFEPGKGLYTNMNAIRRDEITDNLHSIYVDQWDWEKVILQSDRTMDTLKTTVRSIFAALKETEGYICGKYHEIEPILPEEIHFVTSQEMEDAYPALSPSERENVYARQYKAIFVSQIGGALKSGQKHDGRAADYDDWSLNGDILLYYPLFDRAMEISSMGIRVDENAIQSQLKAKNQLDKLNLPFQKAILEKRLPYTIGGGIGQSRLCMYMLRKAHVGEVQVSLWPKATRDACGQYGIPLL